MSWRRASRIEGDPIRKSTISYSGSTIRKDRQNDTPTFMITVTKKACQDLPSFIDHQLKIESDRDANSEGGMRVMRVGGIEAPTIPLLIQSVSSDTMNNIGTYAEAVLGTSDMEQNKQRAEP